MEPARTLILQLGACRTLLQLFLLHTTAAARSSAAAAARRCTPSRCRSEALLLRCSAAAPCETAAAFGSLPKLCCSLLEFSPRLRPGRKTKDTSRSVTCAAACLSCVSMCWCSGLVPRASQCLEGHWVKMRPGASVMAHPRRRMAVGCHRPRAQRCTSCCAVTGTSSAALRGGECFRLLAFFPRTLCGRGITNLSKLPELSI
jgi:hypothetical protein